MLKIASIPLKHEDLDHRLRNNLSDHENTLESGLGFRGHLLEYGFF